MEKIVSIIKLYVLTIAPIKIWIKVWVNAHLEALSVSAFLSFSFV